jgi:hypothetical protein
MGSSLSRNILASPLAAAMLTACVGSGGVPNAGSSSLEAAQNVFGQNAASAALSGGYSGKFRDKLHGTLRVKVYLSQSGSVLGGAAVGTAGSQGIVALIAWTASGHTISGNGIIPNSGPGYCSFSMAGSYKYRRLTGTYKATYGCSGLTGTFALWHKCRLQGMGGDAVRPQTRVKPC